MPSQLQLCAVLTTGILIKCANEQSRTEAVNTARSPHLPRPLRLFSVPLLARFSSTTSRCFSVAFPRPPHHFRPFSSSFLLSMAFRALVRYQPDVPPPPPTLLELYFSLSSSIRFVLGACSCCHPSGADFLLFVPLSAALSKYSSRCSSVPSRSSCKFSVCACLAVSLTIGTHPRYLAVNPKCSKSSRVMHSRFGAGTYPLSFQCFLCSLSVHHHHMALETLTVHLAIVVMYSPRHSVDCAQTVSVTPPAHM